MMKMTACAAVGLSAMIGTHAVRAQTPIPPAPQDFVLAAVQSDHYEMLAANVAIVQSSDPRIRAFAARMLQDHKQLEDTLTQAATASGFEPPTSGISSDQAMLLAGLQGLRGPEFDRTYARQQVLAHTQAVDVEDSFAAAGSDANLRAAAKAALPTIRDHLKQVRQLMADLDKG